MEDAVLETVRLEGGGKKETFVNDYAESIVTEYRDRDNRRHRMDGPAYQERSRDGQLIYEGWSVQGRWDRTDGPARQWWNSEGKLTGEEWYLDDRMHCPFGPAYRMWDDAGRLTVEEWGVGGYLHRLDGPAVQKWDDADKLVKEEWWIDGQKYPTDYLPELDRLLALTSNPKALVHLAPNIGTALGMTDLPTLTEAVTAQTLEYLKALSPSQIFVLTEHVPFLVKALHNVDYHDPVFDAAHPQVNAAASFAPKLPKTSKKPASPEF
jgi:hypothetical protein